MTMWRIYLFGKCLGSVAAKTEFEARVAAEEKFDLTDEQFDETIAVEE